MGSFTSGVELQGPPFDYAQGPDVQFGLGFGSAQPSFEHVSTTFPHILVSYEMQI